MKGGVAPAPAAEAMAPFHDQAQRDGGQHARQSAAKCREVHYADADQSVQESATRNAVQHDEEEAGDRVRLSAVAWPAKLVKRTLCARARGSVLAELASGTHNRKCVNSVHG